MKALTVKQPWAWLIIRPDVLDPVKRAQLAAAGILKDIENREWPARGRGWIVIHSSKKMEYGEYVAAMDFIAGRGIDVQLPPMDSLDYGCCLGKVYLDGCVNHHSSKWWNGQDLAFVLRDPQPFDKPIPARGNVAFWDWAPPQQNTELEDPT